MGFWKFQDRLTLWLLSWGMASIASGLMLGRSEDDFRRGIGEQFVGWGVINAVIAVLGQRGSLKKRRLPDANEVESLSRERNKLKRLLWINTGLDVVYMAGGWRAVQTRGQMDERWRGRGWGIIFQGGFLFFFDLINAVLLSRIELTRDGQE
ncbi:MAG: hypothetical protein R6X18_03975 [Chloroflexota bacterium]|jgi:hypothetical protein